MIEAPLSFRDHLAVWSRVAALLVLACLLWLGLYELGVLLVSLVRALA